MIGCSDDSAGDDDAVRGIDGVCYVHHRFRRNCWWCCHHDLGGVEMQLVQGRIASIGGCWRHSAAAAVHCCCWTIAASATAAAVAVDAAAVGGDGADVAGETQ